MASLHLHSYVSSDHSSINSPLPRSGSPTKAMTDDFEFARRAHSPHESDRSGDLAQDEDDDDYSDAQNHSRDSINDEESAGSSVSTALARHAARDTSNASVMTAQRVESPQKDESRSPFSHLRGWRGDDST